MQCHIYSTQQFKVAWIYLEYNFKLIWLICELFVKTKAFWVYDADDISMQNCTILIAFIWYRTNNRLTLVHFSHYSKPICLQPNVDFKTRCTQCKTVELMPLFIYLLLFFLSAWNLWMDWGLHCLQTVGQTQCISLPSLRVTQFAEPRSDKKNSPLNFCQIKQIQA